MEPFAAMSLALPEPVLPASDARAPLLSLLQRYARAAPATADLFRSFALAHSDCFERSCVPGHFTGSAWLVDRTGTRVLLTHHRKLNKWLQLGGHADGDADMARVALKEAEEESGLHDLQVESEIFDLDRHEIPARADEPAHWHYDVRFVVRARGSDSFTISDESHALAWREIADVAVDESVDESVQRMARKWLERVPDTIPTQPSP